MSLFDSFRLPAAHPDAPVNPEGETALHIAARAGDIEAARKAFEKGASTGVYDIRGQTPLARAAGNGDADMVHFLLARGAEKEIDHAGSDGAALGLAAQGGHLEAMGLLLAAGANIDAPDDDGNTPLMQAVFAGQFAAAHFLLARGANANAARKGGETVLHIAARAGDERLLRALFCHGAAQSIDARTGNFFQTPLHIAALSQEEVSARVLLEMGARTDIQNAFGNTALGVAVRGAAGGKTGLIRLMIEKGHVGTREPCAPMGMTPLHQAVMMDKFPAARELVRLGADPEQGDAEGNTALHIAARQGQEDVAAWLVSTGMNPGLENKAGQTPLMVARLKGDDGMAALLLRAVNNYVIHNKKPKSQELAPK